MSQLGFESNVDDEYVYPLAVEKELADKQYPLDVLLLKTRQDTDTKIQPKKNTDGVWKSDRYTTKVVEGVELIHNNGKILVPVSLQECVLEWYHLLLLVHPGEKWMEATIRF
jgi:hypothetical protein